MGKPGGRQAMGKSFLWTKEIALFTVRSKLTRPDLRLFITRPQGNQLWLALKSLSVTIQDSVYLYLEAIN
jgi:hypothetical protein